MARPLRIEYADGYYHVMNRGRGRQRIFHDAEYFEAFLVTLQEAHQRFGVQVHSYCLMSNHYHLLLKTPEANLSRAMRHVNGLYTQRYNRLKKTDGPLFRGRYKAIVVDSDSYLLQVSRYIHLNPLDAKLVRDVKRYPWSSYPAYLNKKPCPPWLYRDEVLGQLNVASRRYERYRRFVEETPEDAALVAFYAKKNTPSVLGESEFRMGLRKYLDETPSETPVGQRRSLRPSVEAIVACVAKRFKVKAKDIFIAQRRHRERNIPRAVAMHLGQQLSGATLTQLADAFGVKHYGTIAATISRLRDDIDGEKGVEKAIKLIIKDLTI